MKLIQVTEAAKRLGVSRQTLENWGKNGTIKIRKIGQTGNAHWVDADTIDALADTMQDVAHAREMLEREREDIQSEYKREKEKLHDIRRQMFMIEKFGISCYAKEFFLIFPEMLKEIGQINIREARIMEMFIAGYDFGEISKKFGLTRTRVMQIFYKGCRKAKNLENIKDQLNELERLREENVKLNNMINLLTKELKEQQKAEQEFKEMEDAERIEYIKKTDKLLKLYGTRLVDCNLSVRALNCLKSANIDTIGDLAKCKKGDLLKMRNFGLKTFRELDDLLYEYELTFGTDVDKVYRDRIALHLQVES